MRFPVLSPFFSLFFSFTAATFHDLHAHSHSHHRRSPLLPGIDLGLGLGLGVSQSAHAQSSQSSSVLPSSSSPSSVVDFDLLPTVAPSAQPDTAEVASTPTPSLTQSPLLVSSGEEEQTPSIPPQSLNVVSSPSSSSVDGSSSPIPTADALTPPNNHPSPQATITPLSAQNPTQGTTSTLSGGVGVSLGLTPSVDIPSAITVSPSNSPGGSGNSSHPLISPPSDPPSKLDSPSTLSSGGGNSPFASIIPTNSFGPSSPLPSVPNSDQGSSSSQNSEGGHTLSPLPSIIPIIGTGSLSGSSGGPSNSPGPVSTPLISNQGSVPSLSSGGSISPSLSPSQLPVIVPSSTVSGGPSGPTHFPSTNQISGLGSSSLFSGSGSMSNPFSISPFPIVFSSPSGSPSLNPSVLLPPASHSGSSGFPASNSGSYSSVSDQTYTGSGAIPTFFPTPSVHPSFSATSSPSNLSPLLPPSVLPSSGPSVPASTGVSSPFSSLNISASTATPAISPHSFNTSSEPTPVTTLPLNPSYQFLTESSLAVASFTPTSQPTLSNPDQVPTTASSRTHGDPVPSTTFTPQALPSNLPAQIFPTIQLDTNSPDLGGFTLISILFNQELNWPFVVFNQVSSSQIFSYLPELISTALGGCVVKTWVLRVYIPSTYYSPADQDQLGTMWLGYIPSDKVSNLASEIRAPQSLFYVGVQDSVAQALAQRVDSGFSLLSVPDPSSGKGKDGSGVSGGSPSDPSAVAAAQAQARRDAVIGVVSALSAIALLVLFYLLYRSVQRRNELAHHRLSGSGMGERPAGREFDRDSVGGARRRSYYYAEDSLRGWEAEHEDQGEFGHGRVEVRSNGSGRMGSSIGSMNEMIQRRIPVGTQAISAPVLGANTMNW